MDKQFARRIVDYLDDKVAVLDDPRILGKSLKGELGEFWCKRHPDPAVICRIFKTVISC